MTTEWKIVVDDDRTSAVYEPAHGNDIALFICAHGAGGSMFDRGVLDTTRVMRENGIGVVRFNFLYKEKKRGRPDLMPKLMQTFEAVTIHALAELMPKRVLIGGRSMGGRTASMLAASGFTADGLLLLAYPLHTPGKPDKLRDGHLPLIQMPVLCFNGTRDDFCTRELMERAVQQVKTKWDMRWIEGADHSFHVLKSSGRTDAEVISEIGRVSGEWAGKL